MELVLQYVLGWPYGQTILTLGAKENLLITSGQYWRLLTACFLHANFMHIVSNLIGCTSGVRTREVLFGRARYLLVYLASGLFGSLLSYAASEAAVRVRGRLGRDLRHLRRAALLPHAA